MENLGSSSIMTITIIISAAVAVIATLSIVFVIGEFFIKKTEFFRAAAGIANSCKWHHIALDFIDRAIKLAPERAEYRIFRGLTNASLSNRDAAIVDLSDAIAVSLKPEDSKICAEALSLRASEYLNICRDIANDSQGELILKLSTNVQKLDANNTDKKVCEKLTRYMRSLRCALRDSSDALEYDPDCHWAYFCRACALVRDWDSSYRDENSYLSAISDMEKALALSSSPSYKQTLNILRENLRIINELGNN